MGRRYRNREESWSSILWSLAVLCLVVIGAQVYMQYVARKAAAQIMEITTRGASQSMERSRAILEDQKRRADQQARAKEEKEAAIQRARVIEQQRIQRKAAAWDAYFKPTTRCKADPISAECANAHIRAKKKFEETYSDPA